MMARVNCTEEIPEFAVTNGVKQGCVLAPTLFSIFLSAMLHESFHDLEDEIYVQSRQDANLFNVSHFRAKTKTTRVLVRELLFADDSALVAHTMEDIQKIVDAFSSASKKFGLKINIYSAIVLSTLLCIRCRNMDIVQEQSEKAPHLHDETPTSDHENFMAR